MTEDEEFEALEQRLNYKHKEQAMNREDIIRMAREANVPYDPWPNSEYNKNLERFAALVAAAAKAEEREACAKVCEKLHAVLVSSRNKASTQALAQIYFHQANTAGALSAAIRAREQACNQ